MLNLVHHYPLSRLRKQPLKQQLIKPILIEPIQCHPKRRINLMSDMNIQHSLDVLETMSILQESAYSSFRMVVYKNCDVADPSGICSARILKPAGVYQESSGAVADEEVEGKVCV